jgi:hypothetical protein
MSTENPLFVLTISQSVQNSAMRMLQTWPDPFNCEEQPTYDRADQWAPSRALRWTDAKRHPATKHLDLPFHLHCRCFRVKRTFSPASRLTRCEVASPLPKSRVTDVCLVLVGGCNAEAIDLSLIAFDFFSMFSAQKSHVKPQNHLTYSNKRKSSWHVSSPQSAIIK